MPVKREVVKKSTVKSQPAKVKSVAKKVGSANLRSAGLSVPVYSLTGQTSGTLSLPKEIFGAKVNKRLLSQAVRVYMTNQQTLPGSTKGRGEVEGSTAKIYRQKGTGRARHGAIRAPIFVGGGITFGPKPRRIRLGLPQKMRKAALFSALSSKMVEKNVVGLTGIEKLSGKTKQVANLLNKITGRKKVRRSVLIMTDGKIDKIVRVVRNIPGVNTVSADLVNAYEVLQHDSLFVTKEAVEKLKGAQK